MPRPLLWLIAIVFCGLESQTAIRSALATTTLTNAIIQSLRNEVELRPQGESARPAVMDDEMLPGDALATSRESFAELVFNDGSLARVGERVLFRFEPNTRTFRLNNGTVLLLIPPGQGRTRLRTPNATAGIRGSALFIRYIRETDTTLVGALTDSGIEVYNQDETERYELDPGQLAVIINDHIHRIYEFDLDRFYDTSPLVNGLGLQNPNYYANRGVSDTTSEPSGVSLVRAETLTALENQQFDESDNVVENPDFMQMTATLDDLREAGFNRDILAPTPAVSPVDRPSDEQIEHVLDVTEVQTSPLESTSLSDTNRPSVDRQPDARRDLNSGDRPGVDDPLRPNPDAGPDLREPRRPDPNSGDRPTPEPGDRRQPGNRRNPNNGREPNTPNRPEPGGDRRPDRDDDRRPDRDDDRRPDRDDDDRPDRDDDDREEPRGPRIDDNIDVGAGED
jgi:acrosin